jgi:holo-[acyl-carrier protein] synthase
MISGIGNDLIDIRRVEALYQRFGERLLNKIFTEAEREQLRNTGSRNQTMAARLAKRIAAKEAASKALGTGFRQGISWKDFEIGRDSLGKPTITAKGMAVQYLYRKMKKCDKPAWHLSLSDDYPYAQAFVVLELLTAPR